MLICIGYYYNSACDDYRFVIFDSDDYITETISDDEAYSLLKRNIKILQLEINTEYKDEYKCKCYSELLKIFYKGNKGISSYKYTVLKSGDWCLIGKCEELDKFTYVCYKYTYYGIVRGLLVLEPYVWWMPELKDDTKHAVYLRDVSTVMYLEVDDKGITNSYWDETRVNVNLTNSVTDIFDSDEKNVTNGMHIKFTHRFTGDVYYLEDDGLLYDEQMKPTLYTYGDRYETINTYIKSKVALSDISRTDIVERIKARFMWLTQNICLEYKDKVPIAENIGICKSNIIQAVLNKEFNTELYNIGRQLGIIDFSCAVLFWENEYSIGDYFKLQFRGRFTNYQSSLTFQGFMPLDVLGETKADYYGRFKE